MARKYVTPVDKLLQAERARSARIQRYWEKKGIKLGRSNPTGGDPRTMSGAAKLAEIRRHERFRGEAGDVIAGSRGARLSRASWLEYSRLQQKLERRNQRLIDRIENVQLPGDQTVGDFLDQSYGDRDRRMAPAGPGAPGELRPPRIRPESFPSQAALERGIEHLRGRVEDRYHSKRIENAIRSAAGMIGSGGNPVIARLDELNDRQKFVLLHATPFFQEVGFMYNATMKGEDDAQYASTARERADELIDAIKAQIK